MFIVSTPYRLTFGTPEAPVYRYGYIAAYNHPLVRLRDRDADLGTGTVYNLSAPGFLSAEPWNFATGESRGPSEGWVAGGDKKPQRP